MKENVITNVLSIMMGELNQEQYEKLKDALRISLLNYDLTERCTDIMDIDKSYIHYLQLFLIRKKTEGKSERTLKLYYMHLTKLLQYMNKPLTEISEDDLFI